MVEHQPSKLGVAGSSPVSRSFFLNFCARPSRARVAQEAERVLGKDEVGGSSPPAGLSKSMRNLLFLLLGTTILWTGTGCFFGTFQTAHVVRPGDTDWGFFGNFPLYLSRGDRNRAESAGRVYGIPNLGGYLLYGVGPAMDGGLRGSMGEGIGPVLRFQWLGGASIPSALDGALIGYVGYHPLGQLVTFRLDLLFSFSPSPYSDLYGGFLWEQIPDYAGSAATGLSKVFPEAFRVTDPGSYRGVYFGIRMRRRYGRGGWPPAGLALEFAVPLDQGPVPVIFGVQFSR